MDVSPKTLREVEFREKMRGYHPEDVDQFLERVAAGIEVLQDRLRQAIERAQRAEQAANEAGGTDDALRRTLLLAQRTADLAVQEAREQAALIVSTAEQQAQQLVGDAEQQVRSVVGEAERRSQSLLSDSEQRAQSTLSNAEQRAHSMLSEAEQRARRGHEEALVEVRAELAKLEVTRQRLQIDVDGLTRWVSEHRSQLRVHLQDSLAGADAIDLSPPPAGGAPYPFAVDEPPAGARSAADSGFVAKASAGTGGSAPTARTTADSSWAPPSTTSQPAPGPVGPGGGRAADQTIPWAPDAEATSSDEGNDADPYFAELRRAISDNDPLGPRPRDSPGVAGT
ncbi:MAG: DivIVA domain-containing protein [Acidimicrobiales bacterium]